MVCSNICVAVSVGAWVSVEAFEILMVLEHLLSIMCGIKCSDVHFSRPGIQQVIMRSYVQSRLL